jgi:WD40 repeat protein
MAPDGSWVAFMSLGGIGDPEDLGVSRVQVWDLATGTLDRSFPLHNLDRDAVPVVSPDGRWLAYECYADYRTEIRVFDFRTGRRVWTLRNFGRDSLPVGFSADGSEMYSAAHGGSTRVLVWSTAVSSVLREVKLPKYDFVKVGPDGKTALVLLAGHTDATHEIWDLAAGKKLGELGRASAYGRPQFARGGMSLALLMDYYQRPEFKVWDGATAKLTDTIKMSGKDKHVTARVLADDLSAAAVLEYYGDLKVYDAGKMEPRFTFPLKTPRTEAPQFTPDGKRVIAVQRYERAWVLDAATGKPVTTLEVDYRSVKALAFTDGGKSLVAGVAYWPKPTWGSSVHPPEGYLMTWDAATGELRRACGGVDNFLYAVYPSPKGDKAAVVTGYNKDKAEWWDLTAGKQLKVLAESAEGVGYFGGSADGKKFAGCRSARGEKPEIWMWDPATGERLPSVSAAPSYGSPRFTPDGSRMLIYDANKGIQVHRTDDDSRPATIWKSSGNAGDGTPDEPVPLPDGESFVAFRYQQYKWQPRDLYLYDIGREVKFGKTDITVGPIVVSPDGKWVAVGGMEQNKPNPVYLWKLPDLGLLDEKKLADGRIRSESLVKRVSLEGHVGEVFAVAFSPDSKTLATGGHDRLIRLWDVETGKLRATLCAFPPTDPAGVPGDWVAFTPDGFHAGTARGRASLRFAGGDGATLFRPDKVREALKGK